MIAKSPWTTLHPDDIQHELRHGFPELPWPSANGAPQPPLPTPTIHSYEVVNSTNVVLWERIRAGAGDGTVVLAQRQTAGKGQWGRHWHSEPGGVYLSVALTPRLPIASAAHLTLATVLGVAIALREWQVPVWIKWPNDLVVPRSGAPSQPPILPLHKLGGILVETQMQGETITRAVVGLGLNGANPVPEPGISLRAGAGRVQSLNQAAAIAIYGILWGWQYYNTYGIAAVVPAYNRLLAHRGHTLPIAHQGQDVRGQIVGVTATGALRLRRLERSPPPPANHRRDAGTFPPSEPSQDEMLWAAGDIRLGYE